MVNKLLYFFLFSRQKLIIPNGSCPVILNTYFCQKIVAKEDSKIIHAVHSWDTPLPRRSITLAQMFIFKSLTIKSPEKQVYFHWFRGFMLCNNIEIEKYSEDAYLWFPFSYSANMIAEQLVTVNAWRECSAVQHLVVTFHSVSSNFYF